MQIRTPVELGLVIRDRRRQLRLNQSDLARKVGVSRQWIVGIEHGKSRAELRLVLRTLTALGLSLAIEADDRHPGADDDISPIDVAARGGRK